MSSKDKHTWWYLLWCNVKHRYKLISYSATSFMCLGTGIWAGKWVYIKHQENGSLVGTRNAPFVFYLRGFFHSIIVFAKRYHQVLEICHVDTFFYKKTLSILSFQNNYTKNFVLWYFKYEALIQKLISYGNWQLATLEFHEWMPIPILYDWDNKMHSMIYAVYH